MKENYQLLVKCVRNFEIIVGGGVEMKSPTKLINVNGPTKTEQIRLKGEKNGWDHAEYKERKQKCAEKIL